MNPRPRRKGPLARFFEGMDAATVRLLVVAGLGGGGLLGIRQDAAKKVEVVERQAAHADTVARQTRGRMRAAVESLTVRIVRDSIERRREVRALKREVATLRGARPAALQGPQGPPAPDVDEDADDEAIAPVGPPAPPQGLGKRLLKGLGKLFGG